MAPTLYDKKPECGDLIEIFRGSYQHWALYVGNGYVVHLAAACEVPDAGVSSVMSVPTVSSVMSVLTEKAVVKKEKLWDVVGTDRWEINNSLNKIFDPRPVSVIVREALARVGKEVSYSPLRENCEHFVTELRYGKAESRQVWKAGEIAMAAGAAAFGGLGIVAVTLAGVLFAVAQLSDKVLTVSPEETVRQLLTHPCQGLPNNNTNRTGLVLLIQAVVDFPPLWVNEPGEIAMAAGAAAFVGLGIVALAGVLFGGSKKENKNTQ